MKTCVYLHVCCNEQSLNVMMRDMWDYLQFYPNATLRKADRIITVPHIMMHIFVSARSYDFYRLQGLELKGFSVEFGAELLPQQVDLIRVRVRS